MADLVLSLPQPRAYPLVRWLALGAISAATVTVVYVTCGSGPAIFAASGLALYARTRSPWLALSAVLAYPMLAEALKLTTFLPAQDALLWNLDTRLFGTEPAVWLMGLFAANPTLNLLCWAAYEALFPLLIILAVLERDPRPFLRKVTTLGCMGYLCYFVLPACGPAYYLFSTEGKFRNAFPSCHLAWALMARRQAGEYGLAVRVGYDVFVVLIVLGIGGMGEHFAIDAIAAIPFWLAVEYLCSEPVAKYAPEAQPDYGPRLMEVCE